MSRAVITPIGSAATQGRWALKRPGEIAALLLGQQLLDRRREFLFQLAVELTAGRRRESGMDAFETPPDHRLLGIVGPTDGLYASRRCRQLQ